MVLNIIILVHTPYLYKHMLDICGLQRTHEGYFVPHALIC